MVHLNLSFGVQVLGGQPSVDQIPAGKCFQHYNCAASVVDFVSDGTVRILYTNRHDYIDESLVRREFLGKC